jgi:hypothetical protein
MGAENCGLFNFETYQTSTQKKAPKFFNFSAYLCGKRGSGTKLPINSVLNNFREYQIGCSPEGSLACYSTNYSFFYSKLRY